MTFSLFHSQNILIEINIQESVSIQVQFHAEVHVHPTVPPKSPRKTSSMQSKNKLNARPIMSHHSLFLLLKILLLLDKQVSRHFVSVLDLIRVQKALITHLF